MSNSCRGFFTSNASNSPKSMYSVMPPVRSSSASPIVPPRSASYEPHNLYTAHKCSVLYYKYEARENMRRSIFSLRIGLLEQC